MIDKVPRKRTAYKASTVPWALRYTHYIAKYLAVRLRRVKRESCGIIAASKISDIALVAEAAERGDVEAACAMFLELWRSLASGEKLDPVVFEYFEPKLLTIAIYGMALGVRNHREPTGLGELSSLFNLDLKKASTEYKAQHPYAGVNTRRNLRIVELVDIEIERIQNQGPRELKEILHEASTAVESDLQGQPDAIKDAQIRIIYNQYKPFLDAYNEDVLDDMAQRVTEYRSLRQRLSRILHKVKKLAPPCKIRAIYLLWWKFHLTTSNTE